MRKRSESNFFARVRAQAFLSAIIALCAAAAAQAVEPTVGVADNPEVGEILVDGVGRAMYAFTEDRDGVSTCYRECERAWPPVLVDGLVGFARTVDLGMLGTTERNDLTMQLTYAGYPLYFFAQDEDPGDITGHGVNDVWFLVRPDGDLVGDLVEAGGQAALETDADLEGEALFAALMEEGAQVFGEICAACHGRNGAGTRNAPGLVGTNLLDDGRGIARQVMFGGQIMPGFGNRLSDREVAAVLTYIRNSWGNNFGILTEPEVSTLRQ